MVGANDSHLHAAVEVIWNVAVTYDDVITIGIFFEKIVGTERTKLNIRHHRPSQQILQFLWFQEVSTSY